MRATSLRTRLVISFFLVAVPPMLASAYFVSRQLSSAFEANVEHWLGETSRFLQREVGEATGEAQRVASVVAKKLEGASEEELNHPGLVEQDLTLLGSVGYDLLAVYDSERKLIFSSRPFESQTMLPLVTTDGIFQIRSGDQVFIMAGASRPVKAGSREVHVLVGTWLDDIYLNGLKIVTSLDVRLFARTGAGFSPVMQTIADAPPLRPISAAFEDQLRQSTEPLFRTSADETTYKAVYAGLRDVDGQFVAYSYIGLKRSEGFFEQIGRWQLFGGIFLLGTVLSIIVGAAVASILTRPLRQLTQGVRAVTSGDFRPRVPERGSREVTELAAGFNAMTEQLAKVHLLEEELRRRDRFAALGQAAAVIAHEIRNPLGIIKTSTEVIRKRTRLNESEDRMLGYILDEVRRIETLVRDFLDVSQPREPSRALVALPQTVAAVGAFAAPELARRGIAFESRDDSHGAMVEGDPDQLHQACLNLILNAMDAMPNGGTISTHVSATQGQVTLTIHDTGPGVASEEVAKIFNPFFTTKAKGSGLGLAKVMTVATGHGGMAHYRFDRGAAFSITLPRAAGKVGA